MADLVKFNPKVVREEVVKQLEEMQKSQFVRLSENYKESAFFAIEKLTTLEDIDKILN